MPIGDYFVGILFGGILIVSVFIGLCGIGWIVAEALNRLMPTLAPRLRKAMGWAEYGARPTKPRPNRKRRPPVVSQSDIPPAPAPLNDPERRPYSREFALKQTPVAVSDGVSRLLHPQTCPGCHKARRVFYDATGLCLKCDVDSELGVGVN